MDRNQKKDWIADMSARISNAGSVAVASFRALTVNELENLRKSAREAGATIKVTQNRLSKIAIGNTRFGALAPLFRGPTLVAYAEDPISSSRVIFNFAQTNNKLAILGGAMGDEILDASGVERVAKLPTLDEARTNIVRLILTPAGNIARALSEYAKKAA
ncbi:MAG: 50S ribosomal protein L10 [Rickettsiales bacterium]|jgi:large subunit ribosomal protein L10|nr:50S ribosomal protein L10 [Rickettsiales bacterium]